MINKYRDIRVIPDSYIPDFFRFQTKDWGKDVTKSSLFQYSKNYKVGNEQEGGYPNNRADFLNLALSQLN